MPVQDNFQKFQKNQQKMFNRLIVENVKSYFDPAWDYSRNYEMSLISRRVSNLGEVLDVGCGGGFHDYKLSLNPNASSIDALDSLANSIKLARKHYSNKSIKFLDGKIFSKSCQKKLKPIYDTVMSFQVIEHLENYREFVKILSSKLRIGGKLVIGTSNYLCLENMIRCLPGSELIFCDRQHYREFSSKDLINLFKHSNFEKIQLFGHSLNFSIPRTQVKILGYRLSLNLGTVFPRLSNQLIIIAKKLK